MLNAKLTRKFNDFSLDVAFEIKRGINIFFGFSGCGKTLTLRMLAGLDKPDCGMIKTESRIIYDSSSNIFTKPQHRKFAFVPQQNSLFPHMSVEKNVLFGIPENEKKESKDRTAYLLEIFRLVELKDRFPHQLSGGQKQRAAVARAVASKPEILLLDEPFSSLDSLIRRKMCRCINHSVYQKLGIPIIMVTHDVTETLDFDHLFVFSNGRIIKNGRPEELKPLLAEMLGPLRFENPFTNNKTGGDFND